MIFIRLVLITMATAFTAKEYYQYLKYNKKSKINRYVFILAWVIFIELGIFPQVKRGFYCDDRTISRRLNGETITTAALLSTIPVVFLILWVFEAFFFVPVSLKSSRFLESLVRSWKWYKEFLYGAILHFFVIDGLKVIGGELRPHFLDTCRPDALQTCTPGQYVIDWECTNTIDSSWSVRDASKSFPSGHSSTSFYQAVFFIWYLQMRAPKIRSQLLIPLLQCSFMLWAGLCSFSRIVDNRHHFWDVIIGALIGVFFGVLTCILFCNSFKPKKLPNIEPMQQNGNTIDNRHTSVRRLLSERTKDELNMNHVVVP